MKDSLVVIALCLMLASCTQSPPTPLPREEVLRRAVLRMMTFDLVNVHATGSLTLVKQQKSADVLVTLTGTLLPLRHAWFFSVGVQQADHHWPVVSYSKMEATAGSILGPDARLVDVYVRSIVIDDASLYRQPNNSFAYVLRVHLSPDALADASPVVHGILLIDARTFALLHADWTLRTIALSSGFFDAVVSITFNIDTQKRSPLRVMTGSTLPQESIFDMILPE